MTEAFTAEYAGKELPASQAEASGGRADIGQSRMPGCGRGPLKSSRQSPWVMQLKAMVGPYPSEIAKWKTAMAADASSRDTEIIGLTLRV